MFDLGWRETNKPLQFIPYRRKLGNKYTLKKELRNRRLKFALAILALIFIFVIFSLASTSDLEVCLKTAMCSK